MSILLVFVSIKTSKKEQKRAAPKNIHVPYEIVITLTTSVCCHCDDGNKWKHLETRGHVTIFRCQFTKMSSKSFT
jgi:hypothetical protein